MSIIYTNLTTLKTKLAAISGVTTCDIGLESNISPEDYPIIRIVPSLIRNAASFNRVVEVLIYFGKPVQEAESGLPTVYSELLDLEQSIIAALKGNGFQIKYLDTITDEDRLEHYKLMAVRAEMNVSDSCSQ